MSLPINKYPAKGEADTRPHPLFQYPKGMGGAVTGVPANHSTETKSVAGTETVQYRDADDNGGSSGPLDVGPLFDNGNDPNISGSLPFSTEDWQAGGMSGWQDNDDYMDYTYNVHKVAESRLLSGQCYPTGYSLMDGDYDDNGGHNVAPKGGDLPHMHHSDEEFGSDESSGLTPWSGGQSEQGGIMIDPPIRR
jgi:hypothetical protein